MGYLNLKYQQPSIGGTGTKASTVAATPKKVEATADAAPVIKPKLPEAPTLEAPKPLPAPTSMTSMRKLAAVPTPKIQPLEPLSPEQTVAGRVRQMTTTRDPVITTAATRAKQRANVRGLLSSSIAEQAGQQAAIETATPIAAADAAAEQRRREIEYQNQLAVDAEARSAERAREQTEFQTAEERSRIEFQAAENRAALEAERQSRYDLANVELQSKYDIAQYQVDVAAYEANVERKWKDQGVDDQNRINLKNSYNADVRNETRYWDDQAFAIDQNPAIEDKEARIQEIEKNKKDAVDGITAAYESAPNWDSSWEVVVNIPEYTSIGDVPTGAAERAAFFQENPQFIKQVTPENTFSSTAEYLQLAAKIYSKDAADVDIDDVTRLASYFRYEIKKQKWRFSSFD